MSNERTIKQAMTNKKTTMNDYMSVVSKQFDQLLSNIYVSIFPTKYQQIPRRHSFTETKKQLEDDDMKDLTSALDKRRTTVAAIHFKQSIATKSTQKNDQIRKPIYSRHLSRTTNFLQLAENTRKNVIYNWSGIHEIAREPHVVRPSTVNELVRHVQSATSKLTVIGSGLSYEKLMSIQLDDPSAKLISMEHFHGLIEMKENTAVFGAATSVNDVIAILASYNRMLPCCPGVIGIQTLAGAIATGTHGQGLHQSCYSDIVTSLQVVLPSGEVVNIDEHTRDYPLQAFVTAMGTLGIAVQVEVAHVPRRIFSCHKFTCKVDVLLSDYLKWNEESEFVKVWWFPETDFCHVWLVDEANVEQCQQFLATPGDALLESKHVRDSIDDTINQYMKSMELDTKATKESLQPQFETLKRFVNAKDVIGYLEQILCKGIPVPQINCEIGIPLEHATEATLAIKAWANKHKKRLHYPFIYRAVGQSKAWLSPAYKGPALYVGFLVYLAEDGTVREDGMTTMLELQKLLASFDGLPHWGKHFRPDVYDFEHQIPKWKDFLDLCTQIDPEKKMLSHFLENIFKRTDVSHCSRNL